MKIDTLVRNVQKLFATNVNLFDAKDVAKLLAECNDLMNDCGWVYSQELRGDNLIFVYALERCEEKLKFLIERTTQNYLESTGNYIALLNALDDIKESALSTARMQIEIWLHGNTDLTDEQIFNLVWNVSPNPETQDFDSSIDYTNPKELGTFLNRLWKLKSEAFIDGSNIEKFSEKWLAVYKVITDNNSMLNDITNRMLDFLKDVEQVEQENFLWILGKYAGKGLDESERYDIDTIAYNVENHGIMDSLTAFGLLMNRPWPEFENLFDDDDEKE